MSIDKTTIAKGARERLEKRFGPLTFALFMRAARTMMDLTQEEMGKKLGISRANVCDIEKGRQLVSVEFAVKVAKKAQISEALAVKACLEDQIRKTGLDLKIQVS